MARRIKITRLDTTALSPLAASAGSRLILAAIVVALLWLGVLWAMQPS